MVSNSQAAATLAEKAGNVINKGESAEVASAADQLGRTFKALKNVSGPMATAINAAAQQVSEGANKTTVQRKLYAEVVAAMELEFKGKRRDGWAQSTGDRFAELEARIDAARKKCSTGYGCGSTCISLRKECRSKPGSSISQERLKRLQQLAKGEISPRGLGVPRGAAATALATDIQGRRNARAQELLAGRQANRQVKPLAPAQAKTLQPTVVDVEVMPSSGGLAITRQPAAGGLATPGAAAGPRPGSVAAAMRASIEAMRQLDVQQMSRMANDLFESEWTVERNRQWKKLSKEEAKAQFIAKMGQDMQAERAKIAQQSAAAAAAGSGQAKPGSVAAAMRANIEAMKASDQRMAELNRRVVDLRRKAMALELGDLPDELPQAAPPARRRRQLPKG